MTTRPVTARMRTSVSTPHLSPLVLAILAAFPGLGNAQVRPATPVINAVPVRPSVGWVVSTSVPNAGSTLTNASNASGGVNQTINQTSPSAVYNWQSFDIGSGSSVTFKYPSATSSSLNRVTGSASPSAIFGTLTSQYPNPTAGGAPLVGGSIYLINANGILFGKTAQVDTGALIASTLDLQDADFYSGLSQSITSHGYTFGPFAQSGATAASLVPAPNNFVLVDPGAQITTASGGRVFLFANNDVQNAGTITTPTGQTVLAAGDQVFLNLPTNEVMYASEVNSQIPAVNGLLVEVGTGNGSVANIQGGVINTPTGNTTLVGMAVNQSGRINATTSVSQDGSVFLLARGAATSPVQGSVIVKEATVSGSLTLGSGSVIDIEPDTTPGANGLAATSSASSTFTPSLVELAGKTIEMQANSAIVAHGGTVDARAETTPWYEPNEPNPQTFNAAALTGDDARLVLDTGSTIDVSGTTSTTVSAARNFVTTALLGANDLADAPLQRTGPVYRSELTFDVRAAVPILGDTSAYLNAIQKTAAEQLAAGGSIKLLSTGAVATNASSALNISGGIVNYTAAVVQPSELLGSNGTVYTFNQAPANQTYTAVMGAPTGQLDRWGVVPSFSPSQVSGGVVTPGYVAGQAGGSLSIVSPLSILDGQIKANVTQGVRQTAGLDALAAASQLALGARTDGGDTSDSAGVGALNIMPAPGTLGSSFWNDPTSATATLPAASRIAASSINESGLGQFTVTSLGNVVLAPGANLTLPTRGVVDLLSSGGGIELGADISAAGGTISAKTPASASGAVDGGITLDAGARLDVSAAWVNRAIDGAATAAATAGGSIQLSSGSSLDLQDASTIDVSGGATVGVNGKVTGTAAGSVALQSNLNDTGAPSPVHIGADLVANSLGGGGTLTLSADSISVGAGAIPGGVADGQAVGSLVLSNQFFNQGAFTNYQIDALTSLVVQPGATVQPQASNWILAPTAVTTPSGTQPSSFLAVGQLPEAQRQPVSVGLSTASPLGLASGDLNVAAGASIVTDPLASVTLTAGLNLNVAGKIVAPGGNVTLETVSPDQIGAATGSLTVGPRADVDVSGVAVLQPQTGVLPTGRVLAGGHVVLSSSTTGKATSPIVIDPGAVIDADGTSAVLGVTTTNASGNTSLASQSVASAGGSVSIAVGSAGAALAGTMHALGGDASVSGGSFDLSGAGTIVVQQAPVTASTALSGIVGVSAQSLSRGFSDASLQATGQVHFSSDVTLAMAGNLMVDAPVLSADPNVSSVALSGASTLSLGASYQQLLGGAGAIGGNAALSLNGGLVELFGQQVVQGFGNIQIGAASELRLESVSGPGGAQGDLAVQGALTLNAPQIVPTTASQFTFDAPGQQVLITGGDTKAVTPLSAGGGITINAADISTVSPNDASQYGVLRAPFGSIALNASDSITIGTGSVLSVSGAGMTVPYGQTSGAANWTYDAVAVNAPPQKTITLNAPGGSIAVAAGSSLDLSGGGNLLAREFVPGNGGSNDIFAGAAAGSFAIVPAASAYAAQDTDILQQQVDTAHNHATVTLGRDIAFGAGGPIPAGTYAVMPAEYATLAGAFLVTPTASSAPLALGAAVRQTDGSVLMGGQFVEAGTAFASSLTQSFKVQTSTQALTYSEIDQTNANAYFGAQAAAAGTPAPPLPTDAGLLGISAAQLQLKGATLFTLPTVTTTTNSVTTTTSVGRGGELDISADDIQVGGTPAVGVLSVSAADLNATGAALVVLGGRTNASSGLLDVTANSVVVDNADTPLAVNDLVLVANNAVTLQAGSTIAAPAPTTGATAIAAPTLTLSGDGALLRVSADAAATSVRTGAQGQAGSLTIGSGVSLSGGAITAEGTMANVIAADATLNAQAITLSARHVAVGDAPAAASGDGTLVLTSTLAGQVGGAQSLTLRSATGLDLDGTVSLGGASLKSLTVDADSINLIGDNATSTIEAGGVTLTNTGGNIAVASLGNNSLQIKALGTGLGQVLIGSGAVAVSGTNQTAIDAAHEVVLDNGANLSTAGDLLISGAALQARSGASATLTSGGTFTLASSGTGSGNTAGTGAQVAIVAQAIDQQGQLVLPSGQLTLASAGLTDPGATAVHFGSGSLTDVSGRTTPFDGIAVSTPGGTLNVLAPAGNVSVDTGATLDVSATAAQAGSITITAPAGTVALSGNLRGAASAGQVGGSLSVDSLTALDLGALAATINAQANNFSGSLTLRNRTGDQHVATGTALAAQSISISADAGTLVVDGSLTAGGASGASVILAGGAGLDVDAGATIAAHSNGVAGSSVQLFSGAMQLQADGSFAGMSGMVEFNGGVIDTSAVSGGVNGSVLVRVQRGSDGTDLAIGGTGGTTVKGATAIELEAVKQYAASSVETALMAQVSADNATLGATASQVTTRVGALLGTPGGALQLRSGVEIDSTGDLTMVGNASAGGWNLTQFGADGSAHAQASGAPMNLTLRAAGNLDIVGSLSDGFIPAGSTPTTPAAASKITPSAAIAQIGGSYAQGANITLVGGADLAAANVLGTVSSAAQGDVTIGASGKNVLVRSTTGNISIAAGRDVTLLNAQADVYTTGTPVDSATLLAAGYVGNLLATGAYLHAGSAVQSPFLTGGGSLAVTAARDIVGVDPNSATLQYATDWAWRALDRKTNGQPMWWSRYDQFQQGFATFGGGNVTASAQRDIVNGEFSAAGSGYVPRAADGGAEPAVTYGGGALSVQAGRDILGGFVLADGATGNVTAGRDIAIGNAPFALQALYGNTALSIGALDNTELGIVSAIELVPATKEYTNIPLNWYIQGLTRQASLQVQAAAGDLAYDAATPQAGNLTYLVGNALTDLFVPDITSFTAPNGSIAAGKIIQDPTGTTRLSLLANNNLDVSAITVGGTDINSAAPTQLLDINTSDLLANNSYPAVLDLGTRAPTELVAQTGDITLTQGILTSTSLRMIAGRDIAMVESGSGFNGITLQSQAADELSLFQAGRDILFAADGGAGVGGVDFYGPGSLLILAGRNIDLSTSGGVRADGNRQNSALPSASGNVTLEAGVSLQAGDYTQAAAWYFPVLGGTGIAGFAPDLVAQLSAVQANQALPAPGSGAAAQYAALPVASQVAQVRTLVGDAVFNATVLADAQRRNGASVTLAQATTTFASLGATDQQAVLGAALANAWVAALTPAQQQQQVLALANTAKSPFVDSLETFVATQGAPAGLDAAAALSAFEQMAPERQALFTNEVLVSVVRQAGRTASALSGSAQTAAYAPAYAALDTVFPGVGSTGNLSMGASQIETLQNSNIDVLAPRGSVDVGTLVAGGTPKQADFLGIVTADGGNVSVVVGDSVNVDQSRVFTVGVGDLLMWASNGSLDAGRGGKTVLGAPAPHYFLDSTGQFVADVSGSFSGSGIAVLDATSSLDLYAPKGSINAGDAGIKSLGDAYFGAASFIGADNLSVGGVSVGAPPPASTGGATAGLAAVAQSAGAATTVNAGDSEEEKERKRRKRLNLVLDFLGFGDGQAKP